MTANLTTAFNNHFADFVNDILSVFPDDPDILTAKNALNTIRKANPKLLIKIWVKYIYNPYKIQIDNGDINFFLVKDYSTDFEVNDNSNKIIESINTLSKIYSVRPNAFLTRVFFDAKVDELVSILSGGPKVSLTETIDNLNRLSPLNTAKWSAIKL